MSPARARRDCLVTLSELTFDSDPGSWRGHLVLGQAGVRIAVAVGGQCVHISSGGAL